MNPLIAEPEVDALEAVFDLEVECGVDHDGVAEETGLTLPPCGVVAGAWIRDCTGRYPVCTNLALYVAERITADPVACAKHGADCIEIVWF